MFALVYTADPRYLATGGASAGFRHEYSMFDLPEGGNGSDRVVVLSQRLVDSLTPAEIEVIVLHEEGHIALGHLDNIEASSCVVDNEGFSMAVLPSFELEADAYAAARVGAEVVVQTLERTSEFLVSVAVESLPEAVQVTARPAVQAFIDAQINPRIAALRSTGM